MGTSEDVYGSGLMRSLRSAPMEDIRDQAILRSARSGSAGDPYGEGLLRSLRSAPTSEDVHGSGLMRSVQNEKENIFLVSPDDLFEEAKSSHGVYNGAVLRAV